MLSSFRTDFVFAHMQILDELIIAGELQESSKKSVLRVVRGILRILLCSNLMGSEGYTI